MADSKSARHRPVDQDDALAELDEVAESKGESPGELSDAGEGLDSVRDSASALLLLFEPSEQLRRQRQLRMRSLLATSCVCESQSWMFAVSRRRQMRQKNATIGKFANHRQCVGAKT